MSQIFKCNFQETTDFGHIPLSAHKLQAVLFHIQANLFHIHKIIIVGTDGLVF